jgi:hypothetical protein
MPSPFSPESDFEYDEDDTLENFFNPSTLFPPDLRSFINILTVSSLLKHTDEIDNPLTQSDLETPEIIEAVEKNRAEEIPDYPTEQEFILELRQKLGISDVQASYVAAHILDQSDRKDFLEKIAKHVGEFFREYPHVLELILPVDESNSENIVCSYIDDENEWSISKESQYRISLFQLLSILLSSEQSRRIFSPMVESFITYFKTEYEQAVARENKFISPMTAALSTAYDSLGNFDDFCRYIEMSSENKEINFADLERFLGLILYKHLHIWQRILSNSNYTFSDFLTMAEYEGGRLLLQNVSAVYNMVIYNPSVIPAEKFLSPEFLQETELIYFIVEHDDIRFDSDRIKNIYDLDLAPWEKRLRLLEAILRVRGYAGFLQQDIDQILFAKYKQGMLKLSTKSTAGRELVAELDACETFPEDNPLLLSKLRNAISQTSSLTNQQKVIGMQQNIQIALTLREQQGLSTEYVDDSLREELTRREHRLSPLRWLMPTWGFEVEYTKPKELDTQAEFHRFLKQKMGFNMGDGGISECSLEVSPGPFVSTVSGIAAWDIWYNALQVDLHALCNQTLHWNIALETRESMSILMRLTQLAGRTYDTSDVKDFNDPGDDEIAYDATDTKHTLAVNEQGNNLDDLTRNKITYFECKDGRVPTPHDFRIALSEVPVLGMAAKAFEEIMESFQKFGDNDFELRMLGHSTQEERNYACFKLITESDILEFASSDYQARLALVWKHFFDAANQGLEQVGFENFLRKTVPKSQAKKLARALRTVFPNNASRYDAESINQTWEGSSIEHEGVVYPNVIAFIRSLTEKYVAQIDDIQNEILTDFEMIVQEIAENWSNDNRRKQLVEEIFLVFPWLKRVLRNQGSRFVKDDDGLTIEEISEEEIYQEKERAAAEMIVTFIGVEGIAE